MSIPPRWKFDKNVKKLYIQQSMSLFIICLIAVFAGQWYLSKYFLSKYLMPGWHFLGQSSLRPQVQHQRSRQVQTSLTPCPYKKWNLYFPDSGKLTLSRGPCNLNTETNRLKWSGAEINQLIDTYMLWTTGLVQSTVNRLITQRENLLWYEIDTKLIMTLTDQSGSYIWFQ